MGLLTFFELSFNLDDSGFTWAVLGTVSKLLFGISTMGLVDCGSCSVVSTSFLSSKVCGIQLNSFGKASLNAWLIATFLIIVLGFSAQNLFGRFCFELKSIVICTYSS